MDNSPVARLLRAVDRRDADAMMALVAPDARMLAVDGRRAEGADEVRELIVDFLSSVRSMSHRITALWHPNNVWIAEVEATYELPDGVTLSALPRVFVLGDGPAGITELRVYGAHEPSLTSIHTEEGIRVGGRWIPPL